MLSFRADRLARLSLPVSAVWMMTDIAEAKGRQSLASRLSPQLLGAMRETALVESVESSNRIEGVTVALARLQPLVLGAARPRDRPEEEIRGYRLALELIHGRALELSITPALLQRLHATIQEGAGDAGQWKRVDNDIVEMREGTAPRIRFRPVSAAATPAAIEELCASYDATLQAGGLPPLVAVAALVLDFLCIHPFRDGNGRVSRLLTLLALYRQGYEVGRYISLERLVEESRADYYEALRRSSEGWHDSRHDLLPWLQHFLAILRRAYRELESRLGEVKSARGAKTALLEAAIARFPGEFSLADLERAAPGVSRDLARRVLRQLQARGAVKCLGRGPGAAWIARPGLTER
jgi:Fic family protein